MGFIHRASQHARPSDHDHLHDADIVIQIGTAKTALKTSQIVNANGTVLRSYKSAAALRGPHSGGHARLQSDEHQALEVLTRMQHSAPASRPWQEPCGTWNPYSPDDAYPYSGQFNPLSSTGNGATLSHSGREPSDTPRSACYAPALPPSYMSGRTSTPSVLRDTPPFQPSSPLREDTVSDLPSLHRLPSAPDLRHHRAERTISFRRALTKVKPKSRALDGAHLLPDPTKSAAQPSSLPSRSSESSLNMADAPFSPVYERNKLKKSKTASSVSSGATAHTSAASRLFDEAILDQHKTNVRRPPKGIQNWFDAYLDDDDEEEDLDEESEKPEPQELPGDEVLPPAYSAPNRHMSRASEKSGRGPRSPRDSQSARLNGTSRSTRSDSIQSSHLDCQQYHHSRGAPSIFGGESILSFTESELDDEEDEEESVGYTSEPEGVRRGRGHLPAIRDSIYDDRNILIASASTLDVVRVSRPTQLNGPRISHHHENLRNYARSSSSSPEVLRLSGPSAMQRDRRPSHQIAAEPLALRRLNGLSLESTFTATSNDNGMTADTCSSSGTSYQETATGSSQDAVHMVAITKEEKMLLEVMRQKRVAMQQMSFTEGYQLALRTEQQRLAKRTATAEERALRLLKKKESVEQYRASGMTASSHTPTQETELWKQLDAIRNEQVDDRFQMERFLDLSRPPAPLSSHPPSPCEQRKPRAPSGEVLPATRYTPPTWTPASQKHTENSGYFSADECESEAARLRVQQFISSNGAVPPFDSGMKTMRRHTSRQPSSMPASPLVEEDSASVPPVPMRSPHRASYHSRDGSQFTVSTLTHRPSDGSLLEEYRDRSPVSSYYSGQYAGTLQHSPADYAKHDLGLLPRKVHIPGAAERELSKSFSQPDLHAQNGTHVGSNSASPLGSLIDVASRGSATQPTAPPPTAEYYRPRTASSTDIRPASAHGGVHQIVIKKSTNALGKQRSQEALPKLHTVDSVVDVRASMLSITSAGEEVLNAWAELGGGHDCLKTKIKRRVS